MNRSIHATIIEGPISRQLLRFFFPIFMGSLLQQLYNSADAVIVGKFLGKEALAAVGGTTGTLINLFIGFFVGISSGFSVIIAQHYGARHRDSLHRCVHTAVAFAAVSGFFLAILGFFFSGYALSFMKVETAILSHATTYLKIYSLGIVSNLLYNMGASILRATGDSKSPLLFLIFGCVANIFLDIAFVIFLNWGIFGAALATIISQTITAVMAILRLSTAREGYRLFLNRVRFYPVELGKMLYLGIAAGLQSLMYTSTNIVVQMSVNSLGTNTTAAWTAYNKIDALFWITIQAMGISVITFVGQNFGAGRPDRVIKGMQRAFLLGFSITGVIITALILAGPYALLIFTDDPDVIRIGQTAIAFMTPCFLIYVTIEIYSAALRAIGDTWVPMIMTSIGVCILRILWLLFGFPVYRTLESIMLVYPASWIVTSLSFIIYSHTLSPIQKVRRDAKKLLKKPDSV